MRVGPAVLPKASAEIAISARRSIIGSEQGLELGVRVESPANPVKRVGSHDDIGVHEEDDPAARARNSLVAGGTGA